MREHKIYHPLWMAFYSRELYRDVGKNWRGFSFWYLLFLLLVVWAIAMIRLHRGVGLFIEHQAPELVEQIPLILIVKGRAVADIPQPHCIRYPDSDRCLAIIDTSGAIQSLEQLDAPILMTETEIIYKRNDQETRSYSFANIDEFVLDQQRIAGWLAFCKTWLAVALYPLIICALFVYRSFQAILYAVLGIAMSKFQQTPIAFSALASIAAVALTPAIIVNLASMLSGFSLNIHPILYLLLSMAYLWFGIDSQKT